MTVHLDVSQLLQEPRRSGIQRVERELIRHWPGPETLLPCAFDPEMGAMRELGAGLLTALCAEAGGTGPEQERRRLAPDLVPGPELRRGETRLLCAELFADPARAAYYQGLPGAAPTFWLVYDFLPWLHPEWFAAGPAASMMPYLQALRTVPNLAFISHATQRECERRILRRPAPGPVIPLGADGLGLERQRFARERRSFVMLGTIEARKNAAVAMRAFRRLWAEGSDAELVLIGTLERDAREERALLGELAAEPRFRHLQHLSDAGVRQALASARALLFPSGGEGYGLPPIEALHAGLPAIVWAGLPALEGLPALGQVRLPEITPESVAGAVRRLLDDDAAARLWDEAAQLRLPGWRDFAAGVADWVRG